MLSQEFACFQSAPKALMKGAIRSEWQALCKNRNAAVAPWVRSLRAGRKRSWAVLRSLDQSAGSGLGPRSDPEGVQYRDVLHQLAKASPALARLAHDRFRPAEIMRTPDSAH